ncbi:hypothetical protein HMPREF1503_1573 [Olsenella uli MSTE5]|nr:hypothetical protein HMPREF1503_1573 [Olsenella uli MSTE5]
MLRRPRASCAGVRGCPTSHNRTRLRTVVASGPPGRGMADGVPRPVLSMGPNVHKSVFIWKSKELNCAQYAR